jgi:hypothetical protein
MCNLCCNLIVWECGFYVEFLPSASIYSQFVLTPSICQDVNYFARNLEHIIYCTDCVYKFKNESKDKLISLQKIRPHIKIIKLNESYKGHSRGVSVHVQGWDNFVTLFN